ncbi:MAG: TonB-dependent receptor, partial [Candidatus Eremiobacteraeota bacterium]|nr:TonB-dependent receptor [Candidatus Eremiobacteraeota bacterium]
MNFRRLLAACALLSIFASSVPLRALAQSDSGQITITVTDAANNAPIVLARVLLNGPVISSEYSGTNGSVRFTQVPDGIYSARIFSRGYQAVTSDQFEIVNGRAVSIAVSLAKQETLTIIGSVSVRSTAAISTSTLSDTSPQRKLSDTLADALNKISGVSVSTSSSDSDATQTVSLEGHDASQTALTLDGIPLNAPGTAGDLRQISTDLFSGASASFGPQIGGLGGGVGFRTIEPTLSWESKLALSAGSNGKSNYSFAESGSLGKLGVALQHTYRSSPSLIDGQTFADTSGLDYSHDGESLSTGDLVKLRYTIGQSQVLTGTYLASNRATDVVCLQFTGPLPCGFGPGNTNDGKFQLFSLVDTALIGDTSVQAAIFGSRSTSTHDLLDRFVGGEAQPTGSSSLDKNTGFTLNATLPARDRHTISISASSSSSSRTSTPLIPSAQPYASGSATSSYSSLSLNDAIRSSAQLKLNTSLGVSQASNAAGSILGGITATWSPTAKDSYSASYNIGGVAAHPGRVGLLSDPNSLRFDCNGNVAYGSAPGDEPGASSSNSARVSYTHNFKAGLVSASLYRQVQNDTVLPTQVNGTALLPYGVFPPGYFGLVQNAYDSIGGCNASGATFGPQNVYFSTPIGNVRRVYEGMQASGYFTLGNLVAQPYYNISVSKALSSDPRINNPYSISISGNQLPNVPLHRAGLTLDYRAPKSSLEYLLTAQYTSANNPQNLPSFTTVDAGVSAALQRGTLTFAANNVFDTFGGTFAGNANAVPYTTAAGTQILTIARPLAPRQYSVTYSINFGPGARA